MKSEVTFHIQMKGDLAAILVSSQRFTDTIPGQFSCFHEARSPVIAGF
jgi:hypothetical protein